MGRTRTARCVGPAYAIGGETSEKNEATPGRHDIVFFGDVPRKEGKEVVSADGRGFDGSRVDKGNRRIVAVEIGKDVRVDDAAGKGRG